MTTHDQRAAFYDRLTRLSASRAALLLAFGWGLAEATLFFVVPDVFLGCVALFRWRSGLAAMLAAVLGALFGGALMYGLGLGNPAGMHALLVRIPLIKPAMLDTVAAQMHTQGLLALISGPLQAIPYKIYAVQAGEQQLPLALFLLLTVPARLERMLPVVLLASLAGSVCKPFVRRHAAVVLCLYLSLWFVVYLLYFAAVR